MAENTVIQTVEKDLSYIKTHLFLLSVVVILAGGLFYLVDSIIAKHDVANEMKDQQLLTIITAQTADLKTRMTQDEQANSARDLQYAGIIQQLNQTIAKQTGQLQQQIKQNATLNAEQTANAISQKTKAQTGEVTAAGDNVTLDLPIARTINSDLDTLVTTTLQLSETQKQLQAETSLQTDTALDVVNAKNVIVAQDTQLKAADRVCTDRVNVVKSQARKSKFKWFLAGILTGLGIAHPLGI